MSKIYVSICSFRDPLLHETLKSLMETKSIRNEVTYAIFDQTAVEDALITTHPHLANHPDVIYKRIDPQYSDGCSWARSINSIDAVDGYDFFYQIDSHMIFDEHWDRYLIKDYRRAVELYKTPKIIVTGATKAFDIDEETGELKKGHVGDYTTKVGYYKFNKETFIPKVHGDLTQATEDPMPALHIMAGNLFTTAEWVREVGIDSRVQYDAEEPLLALRSYQAKWRMVHHSVVKTYHLSDTAAYPTKQWHEPVHTPEQLEYRNKKTIELWKRFLDSLDESILLQFKEEFGVDYINLTFEERATSQTAHLLEETWTGNTPKDQLPKLKKKKPVADDINSSELDSAPEE